MLISLQIRGVICLPFGVCISLYLRAYSSDIPLMTFILSDLLMSYESSNVSSFSYNSDIPSFGIVVFWLSLNAGVCGDSILSSLSVVLSTFSVVLFNSSFKSDYFSESGISLPSPTNLRNFSDVLISMYWVLLLSVFYSSVNFDSCNYLHKMKQVNKYKNKENWLLEKKIFMPIKMEL